MTVIYHTGFNHISTNLGSNDKAIIANQIFFRQQNSVYNDNGKRFYLMKNIKEFAQDVCIGISKCRQILKSLEIDGWISRKKVRCFDCGVRFKVFVTEKLQKLMIAAKDSKDTKNSSKASVYADLMKNDKSDINKNDKSYIKVQKEKEYNNNQSKNYNPKADFENNLTVNFDFRKYGFGSFECEAVVKKQKTNNQLKAIKIIIENNSDKINSDTFQDFIDDEKNQSQASDFRDLVEMAYCHARTETTETLQPVNADVTESKQEFDLEDIALRIIDKHSTVELATVKKKLLELNEKYDFDSEKDLVSATICELELITEDEYIGYAEIGHNSLDVADIVEDTETIIDQPKPLKITSTTQLPEYLEVVSENDVCESTEPTKESITMPKLNKTTLLRNLKNEADQSRYNGTLPYSQCKALAGVINYVQRECGVIIGCENEVYQWLYFMASNPKYHYTKAKNFEHFCNIAMAQLKARRLHKPIGFDKWLLFVEDNIRKVA